MQCHACQGVWKLRKLLYDTVQEKPEKLTSFDICADLTHTWGIHQPPHPIKIPLKESGLKYNISDFHINFGPSRTYMCVLSKN